VAIRYHTHLKTKCIYEYRHMVRFAKEHIVYVGLTIAQDKVNVQDILEKGLDDLSDLCDVVIEKFEGARDDYHKKNPP
jgi:hypothetical protein